MNHIHAGILTLIRSAITGQSLPLPEDFRLEEAQTLILAHQVSGLCYEGAVACGLPKSDPVMGRLFQKYCRAIIRSNSQMKALEQLYGAFEDNGIDYLPVKGCVLKPLYPNPAMRIMGDADVLIRMEQYPQIRTLMQQLGYTEKPVYHHELPWAGKALHLELHRSLMPDYHTLEHNHFADVWKHAVHAGGCRYDQTLEDAFVYLFVHYTKHYRAGGIGIRQPIDLWIWQKTYPQTDMSVVRRQLEAVQLLTFFDNTQRMLGFWFDAQPADDKVRYMTDYIFSSGSWGNTETQQASGGLLKARQAGSIQQAQTASLLKALFPSAAKMQERYPVLKKAPWLLPVLWPVRWVSALLFRRKNIKKSLTVASAEKIESFEQSLAYVGLDFHV